MVKRLKNAPRLGIKMNYDPVVKDRNTKGFTKVNIERYCETRGLITRQLSESELLGYCVEPAAEVLKRVFPKYSVTSFNNRNFFASHDLYKTTPMIGLGITRMKNIPGIKGTLNELLALPEIQKLKRGPINPEVLERIRAHITGEYHLGVGNPRLMRKALYKDGRQMDFDEKEILRLIGIEQ